jgi:uncharacterized lipoprotein YmbA
MNLRPVVLAGALALTCVSCASPGEHYYTLVGGKASTVPATAAARMLVIEPVTVPEAENRPQLVLGSAPQQRTLLEQERWVEPLPEDLQRALAQSLSSALPAVAIRLAGDRGVAADVPRLYVQVRRFDLSLEQGAFLEAHWVILGADRVVLQEGDFAQERPATRARDYAALVAAQAATVAAFAQQLALTLN